MTETPATAGMTAELSNWRRFTIPGSIYLGIARTGDESTVCGQLRYIASKDVWDLLDAYEGDCYERVPCNVTAGIEQFQAQVYMYRFQAPADTPG